MSTPEQIQRSEGPLPERGPAGPMARAATTYYNRPMIKKPTWKWYIPGYFWLGGIAGGAAVIGAGAELLGGDRHRSTVRHARYLTLALSLICPLLLITDLGHPLRFHHMLRIVKIASPLNIGTWILSLFGLTSGALAVKQFADDMTSIQQMARAVGTVTGSAKVRAGSRLLGFARLLPSRPLAMLHGLLGLCLGGYTGVLIAATAVPLWAAGGILMGPLFLATAFASGAAALALLGSTFGSKRGGAQRQVETIETVGLAAQLGLMTAYELMLPHQIRKPLHTGLWGYLYRFGALGCGTIAPLALRLATRWTGRQINEVLSTTASLLAFTGSLVERFALVEAGKLSAEDPIAYQELTRGAPGEAWPTPYEQARQAPKVPPYREHFVAPEVTG